jgi:hypothetical protein
MKLTYVFGNSRVRHQIKSWANWQMVLPERIRFVFLDLICFFFLSPNVIFFIYIDVNHTLALKRTFATTFMTVTFSAHSLL